ncbi:MAG: transcription-repair coupling factor, partial [Hyphomonadaceae bacterium]
MSALFPVPPARLQELARAEGAVLAAETPDGLDAIAFAAALRLRGGAGLFVTRDEGRAAAAEAAVAFFTPELEIIRLPGWDNLPFDRISPTPAVAAQRSAVLSRLARRKAGEAALLVIATASAVTQRAAPRARLAPASFSAAVGEIVDSEALETYLQVNGYARAGTVRAPGDYAVRGGVTDVFPPGAAAPIRFDFFGDQLESIRAFDPETQRSTAQLKRADLTPVSEILMDDESVRRFRAKFVDSFGVAADPMYDSVTAHMRRQGMEQWLPFFYERLETVLDYIGPEALIGLEHLAEESCKERYDQAKEHFEARRAAPLARGATPFRAPQPDALYLSPEALAETFDGRRVRRFTPFAEVARGMVISLGGKAGR